MHLPQERLLVLFIAMFPEQIHEVLDLCVLSSMAPRVVPAYKNIDLKPPQISKRV